MSTCKRFASPGANCPSPPPNSANILRCFVGLFPDPAAGEKLDALATDMQRDYAGSRKMRREQLHLTLAFIGPLVQDRADQVAQMLDAIPADPFFWALDRIGGFDHAHVLWVGGKREPRLIALVRIVRRGLDAMAINYDRKAFSAHVTLLRNIRHVSASFLATPIAWHVTRPYLVVSERDLGGHVQYRCWGQAAAGLRQSP